MMSRCVKLIFECSSSALGIFIQPLVSFLYAYLPVPRFLPWADNSSCFWFYVFSWFNYVDVWRQLIHSALLTTPVDASLRCAYWSLDARENIDERTFQTANRSYAIFPVHCFISVQPRKSPRFTRYKCYLSVVPFIHFASQKCLSTFSPFPNPLVEKNVSVRLCPDSITASFHGKTCRLPMIIDNSLSLIAVVLA